MVSKSDKQYFGLLIGLLMGMIIGALTLPKEVWAAEALVVPTGTTVIDDISHPDGKEIEEATSYLSENHIVIPAEIKETCKQYGKEYNICPEVLMAVCWVESNCKPEISNASGSCHGIAQIHAGSHRKRMSKLGVSDLFNADENIHVSADYIAELLIENDLETSLCLYNGVNASSTSYSRKVLKIAHYLEVVHW